MKETLRICQIGAILGSIIFFLGAIFSYNYQESSHGMLPVIHYPFRENSGDFLIISICLGIIFLLITIIYEIRD
ncbi:MAG: hypothetical protein ACFFFH_05435 [Candidatus Thorarchaeota archaeon]